MIHKISTLLILFICFSSVSAQLSEKMSCQTVIRDANNNMVSDQMVKLQLTILQGTESGAEVYKVVHSPVANANGLVSVELPYIKTGRD